MTGISFFKRACLATTLLVPVGATTWAQTPAPVAADQASGDAPTTARAGSDKVDPAATIVVTGSRVATATNTPTPVTMVSTAQLAQTTPSSLPQALAKLPVFMGSSGTNVRSQGGANNSGTRLNLRNFGTNRNLVLLDGHRVAPNNADGSVNTDVLPEMLIQRVDVVTGGASAVYGSDAVSGVVNFILDKKFTGLKAQANYGLNEDGEGKRYQAGIAAGTSLFDGRGHIEGTFRYFHQDQALIKDLPYGKNGLAYTYGGNGTAAAPYILIPNSRRNDQALTGLVSCGTTCAANGLTFIQNGILGPFERGQPTSSGSPNLSAGGVGRVDLYSAALTALKSFQTFGRFSYDITNDITFWAQGRASKARYYAYGPNNGIPPGSGASARPNIFFTDNPYLTPAARTLLEQGNTSSFTAADGTVHKIFTFVNYQPALTGQSPKLAGVDNLPIFAYTQRDRNISGSAGVDGKIGQFDFSIEYSHDDNRAQSIAPANDNFQLQYASDDAVVNAAGQIACYVSTTANAGLYPGCIPSNPFGYNSLTADQYAYYSQMTKFSMTNRLDDISASISGGLFDLPAGTVKAALSGEARWAMYKVVSNAEPGSVNCAGLRLCSTVAPLYFQTTLANVAAVRQNVVEAAGEVSIPVLKDLPFFQSLSLDIAGRYTDYSVSGTAKTWKVGGDWRPVDGIRLRGTASSDIRAPTLNDLFAPSTQGLASLNDIYTGRTADTVQFTRGNPQLKPERARTYTAGIVLTPAFIPGFSFSADFYTITLKDAITSINYSNAAVQQICIAAIRAGGTSSYCDLATRPLPLSNSTQANFPSSITTLSLNSAKLKTKGYDFEANYRVPMDQMQLPGTLSVRGLLSIQPYVRQIAFPGAVPAITPQPHYRITGFANYSLGDFSLSLQDRWLSSWDQAQFPGQIYAKQRIASYNQLDATFDYAFFADSKAPLHVYVAVEDVFNKKYPIAPSATSAANPGISYPVPNGFGQYLNRYFTFGVRKTF